MLLPVSLENEKAPGRKKNVEGLVAGGVEKWIIKWARKAQTCEVVIISSVNHH